MIEIEIKDGYVIDLGMSLVDRVALALFNHDMSRFTTQRRVEWTEQDLIPEHGSADIYRGNARAAITEMIRSTSQQRVVGVDFGPKPAAIAIAQIEVDLCFEALPDFLLK